MSFQIEVKISIILHATESIDKIFESLANFGLEQDKFEIQNLVGHFNNPITLLSINLKKKNAESFITNILGAISKTDYNKIYENIEDYVSGSGLKLKINIMN